MSDISEQSKSPQPQTPTQIIPKNAKIIAFSPRQPIKIIKCGVQKIQPANQTAEILTLLKTIISKQESIEKRMDLIEKSVLNTENLISKNIFEGSEISPKNQLTRDCKVKVKRVRTIGRTSEQIEEDTINEIAAEFPLETMDAIAEVEQKLNGKLYNKSMIAYLKRFKDASGSVDRVLRQIFTDSIIKNFNWDGRWGKKSLNTLKIVDQIVFELYQVEGRNAFERHVKKYVELSHNRYKQKLRLEHRIKQQHELLGYP